MKKPQRKSKRHRSTKKDARVMVTERDGAGKLAVLKRTSTGRRKKTYANKALMFVRGAKGQIVKTRVIGKRSPREWHKGPWPIPGKKIKIGRVVAHSLGAVAQGTGLGVACLSRIFAGKREPRLGTASRIASFFGVAVEELAVWLAEQREKTA